MLGRTFAPARAYRKANGRNNKEGLGTTPRDVDPLIHPASQAASYSLALLVSTVTVG